MIYVIGKLYMIIGKYWISSDSHNIIPTKLIFTCLQSNLTQYKIICDLTFILFWQFAWLQDDRANPRDLVGYYNPAGDYSSDIYINNKYIIIKYR